MAQATFSQYLTGKSPINLKFLLRVSKILGVDPATIAPELAAELPESGLQGRIIDKLGRLSTAQLARLEDFIDTIIR